MSTTEKSIGVNVPEYVAYNQWTCFEEFPRFMEGVKEVKQLAPKRLHWEAEITGQNTEWDAEITEHTADRCVALTYRGGAITGWVATFYEPSNDRSTVVLQVEYDPQGVVDNVGDAWEVVSPPVQGDPEQFKELNEEPRSKLRGSSFRNPGLHRRTERELSCRSLRMCMNSPEHVSTFSQGWR